MGKIKFLIIKKNCLGTFVKNLEESKQEKEIFGILTDAGILSEFVYKLGEGRPNINDLITNGKVDLVINTPVGADEANEDSYLRKAAIKKKVPYITTIAAAKAAASGIKSMNKPGCGVMKSLQELHAEITEK